MKRLIFVLFMFLGFSLYAQKFDVSQILADDSTLVENLITISDTTVVPDEILKLVSERLFDEKIGLVAKIGDLITKEKLKTDTIQHLQALQIFSQNLATSFNILSEDYFDIKEVSIDKLKLERKIAEIQKWQKDVVQDPDMRKVTSTDDWLIAASLLDKFMLYNKKIKNKEKTKN